MDIKDALTLILQNQVVMINAISKLLTPKCKGMMDKNGETRANVSLMDQYHRTKDYLDAIAELEGGV